MTLRYGIKIRNKTDQVTIEAEDPLIAALKVKTAHPEAAITYVRKQNARGDRRHPHASQIDKKPGRSGGGACGLAGRRCRDHRRAVFRGTASCYPGGGTGGLRRGARGGPRTELRRQTMAKRLFIVLVNTDPRNPEELGAPFYHAAAAASMDYEVDVVCTATAGKLMRKGVAEALFVKPGAEMSVHDWIRQAHELGARFWACPANLELFDMKESDLIAECSGLMGAATMLHQLMEDDCRVLTY